MALLIAGARSCTDAARAAVTAGGGAAAGRARPSRHPRRAPAPGAHRIIWRKKNVSTLRNTGFSVSCRMLHFLVSAFCTCFCDCRTHVCCYLLGSAITTPVLRFPRPWHILSAGAIEDALYVAALAAEVEACFRMCQVPIAAELECGSVCRALAKITGGFSGAELANVVNEAALLAGRKEAEVSTFTHTTGSCHSQTGFLWVFGFSTLES